MIPKLSATSWSWVFFVLICKPSAKNHLVAVRARPPHRAWFVLFFFSETHFWWKKIHQCHGWKLLRTVIPNLMIKCFSWASEAKLISRRCIGEASFFPRPLLRWPCWDPLSVQRGRLGMLRMIGLATTATGLSFLDGRYGRSSAMDNKKKTHQSKSRWNIELVCFSIYILGLVHFVKGPFYIHIPVYITERTSTAPSRCCHL